MREEENPVLPITVPQSKYFIKNKEKKNTLRNNFVGWVGWKQKFKRKFYKFRITNSN